MRLTKEQSTLVNAPLDRKIWLEGIAGAGKTTAGVQRMMHLLKQGVPAESILILVPQRALAQPYMDALKKDKKRKGGQVTIHTIGSLALKMVELFWLLAAKKAGFKKPTEVPNFLSLELAQYYMTRVIGPVIEEKDYFNSVRLDRARLYSQIVDNLNKSAVVGFSIDDLADRLKSALKGDVEQQYIYEEAKICASLFRQFCLDNSLLDFSLQMDVLVDHLWKMKKPHDYLTNQYKHLIVDNIEEDNPASHRIVGDWLKTCQSALLIYDTDAGYRRFLGADAEDAYQLRDKCNDFYIQNRSFVMSNEIAALGAYLSARLSENEIPLPDIDPRSALQLGALNYHPQMINWVVAEISSLINQQGVNPNEIVILAPFLSDALRFALMDRLEAEDIKVRSHRPSRALRDEPAARALLTLAKLAHPQWGIQPADFDVAYALMTAIEGLDFIRAKLLVEILYRKGVLGSFDSIAEAAQNRITFELGGRYESLRKWLETYQGEGAEPIDIFFRQLFGERLSQDGFCFHDDMDAAKTAANLVDSARNFRWAVEFASPDGQVLDSSLEYIQMVDGGVIANFYLRDWTMDSEDSVLIAPAYTFLLNNRPVDYQFWINIGSEGWSRRLYQPLTHPYVLSLQWQVGETWDDEDEVRANQDTLNRLVTGLVRRCRKTIYLGYSELGESGYEQRGLLLDAIQNMLRRLTQGENDV